jgi:ABC-type dipeptide/oligopeptide/nickel transport system permease component
VLALVATVIIAPTLAYVVFGALAGTLGESIPAGAGDYVVKTFWHFDLGYSQRFNGSMRDVLAWTLPVDLTTVVGSLTTGMALGVAGGLVAAQRPDTVISRGLQGLAAVLLCCPPYFLPLMVLALFAPGVGKIAEIPFLSPPNLYREQPHDFLGWAHLLWLPVFIVALPVASQVLRMTLLTVRDTVQILIIETTTFVVVANMLADAVQAWLDPTVR